MNGDAGKSLVGHWVSDAANNAGAEEKTTLDFTSDGSLTYTTLRGRKAQKMFLTYRVENGVLITNQPSHPREEKSAFYFKPDGRLVVVYGGDETTFVREAASPKV